MIPKGRFVFRISVASDSREKSNKSTNVGHFEIPKKSKYIQYPLPVATQTKSSTTKYKEIIHYKQP